MSEDVQRALGEAAGVALDFATQVREDIADIREIEGEDFDPNSYGAGYDDGSAWAAEKIAKTINRIATCWPQEAPEAVETDEIKALVERLEALRGQVIQTRVDIQIAEAVQAFRTLLAERERERAEIERLRRKCQLIVGKWEMRAELYSHSGGCAEDLKNVALAALSDPPAPQTESEDQT